MPPHLAIEQNGLLVPVLKLFYKKTILEYLDLGVEGVQGAGGGALFCRLLSSGKGTGRDEASP